MGTRCADHVTPLYPQKLALTSPTGGGRSVGMVRVRTKATELVAIYTRRRFRIQKICISPTRSMIISVAVMSCGQYNANECRN